MTLDNEPKTTRSKRSVPVARSIMRRPEQHLSEIVDSIADALVFTAPAGGPLFPLLGTHGLGAGRAARRVGRPNIPCTSAQLCSDHGGSGVTYARSPSGLGITASRSRWRRTTDCSRTVPMPRSTALTHLSTAARPGSKNSMNWMHCPVAA
jgi:hypothetical protein